MVSSKFTTRLLGASASGALLFGIASATALAAPAVVVKSSANKYPVGSKVDDTDTITLEGGDSVTVLTKKGTRTMKGPGRFKVGEKPKANGARFADLTRKRAASKGTTGAIRGADVGGEETRPVNPNLYYVDVERSGKVCLYDLAEVRLWRPYNGGITTYQVSGGSPAANVAVTFDDGMNEAPLDPERLTVTEGKTYTISGPDGAEPTKITFVDLGQQYRRPDELAATLFDKGCSMQFELLAQKVG